MKRPKLIQETFNFIRYKSFEKFPKLTLKAEFRRHVGYSLNLNNPSTFNEKLQWLKLNWHDKNATICADKYEVRGFIKEKGLSHILNDLYGVYDNVDDIQIDELPEQFVMKVTHGCGQNLICTDKSKLNWEEEKKNFKKWMNISHYYKSLEWVYKDIKPRIIVEKLINTSDGKPPKDYKVFCFNGEPKLLLVASDRGDKTTKVDFYDTEWNILNMKIYSPNSLSILEKPKQLDKILEYSKLISKEFPHARVDFYIENNKVIFGECTFFHMSGMQPIEPIEYDYKLGEYLRLPIEL